MKTIGLLWVFFLYTLIGMFFILPQALPLIFLPLHKLFGLVSPFWLFSSHVGR